MGFVMAIFGVDCEVVLDFEKTWYKNSCCVELKYNLTKLKKNWVEN
jgi:hypothetical protein